MRPIQHIEAQDPSFAVLRRQFERTWLIWGVLSLLALLILGGVGLMLSIIALGSLLIRLALHLYHRLQIENFQHYKQLEALFSLHQVIDLHQPLPPTRLWAASPDFLTVILAYLKTGSPMQVVELGSGVSTLVIGYALKAEGRGKVLSLDHDPAFGQISRRRVENHALSEVVTILDAPLRMVTLQGQTFEWYDMAALDNLAGIDLLIVDGPPEGVSPLARYPALPLLYDKLNAGALIVCDDAQRQSEQAIITRWLAEFPLELVEIIDNEKGAVVLQKR